VAQLDAGESELSDLLEHLIAVLVAL
jgi:hypothetical protein